MCIRDRTNTAPTDTTSTWSAVAYGAHRFVAVDALGNIAWSATTANCAAIVPTTPQQVSGNIHSGMVWTLSLIHISLPCTSITSEMFRTCLGTAVIASVPSPS